MTKIFNFEESMARLAEIADLLEKDTLPLDDSIKLFEEGLELSKKCQLKLDEYENKVKDLVVKHQNDNNDSTN